MDVDLVVNVPHPLRPAAAHSKQHVKIPLASEFRTARIVCWGIGHPPQSPTPSRRSACRRAGTLNGGLTPGGWSASPTFAPHCRNVLTPRAPVQLRTRRPGGNDWEQQQSQFLSLID